MQKKGSLKSITQKKVNDLVVEYIVSEFQPLRTVEKQSFIKLITGLSPSSTVMCRATLSNKINAKTLRVVIFAKEQIKASIAVCTTADIWSCLKKSYMGVTAHWINDDLTSVGRSGLSTFPGQPHVRYHHRIVSKHSYRLRS